MQEILQENARHPGQKMAPVGGGTSLCLPGDVIPLSTSRLTRRKVIEKEHISVQQADEDEQPDYPLLRPYASDDW